MKNPWNMEQHMDLELGELKQRLLVMASHAETAVSEAMRALTQRDHELALKVRDNDNVLDQFEIEIDDMVIHLLAKAPLASDLRFVMVAMKISQNLERVGDEAAKIAKRARDLSGEPPLNLDVELPRMSVAALAMLKSSLDSFVNRDAVEARTVIPRDKEVNTLNKQISGKIAAYMAEHPDTIKRCLHLLVVTKSLERIADHAKNVAEEVVFLCEAQDIRHAPK